MDDKELIAQLLDQLEQSALLIATMRDLLIKIVETLPTPPDNEPQEQAA